VYSSDKIFADLVPLLRDEPDFSPLSNESFWARVRDMAASGGVALLLAFSLAAISYLDAKLVGQHRAIPLKGLFLSPNATTSRHSLAGRRPIWTSWCETPICRVPLTCWITW
jgi:hypothetical protein